MNNYKKITVFSFIFPLFFVLGRFALEIPFVSAENGSESFFFNKNLKVGDVNEDVRNLQKILNKNTETQVSPFGAGSSGSESDFFGQSTKNAVMKFQELHASEILRPFGLKSGTGFVGAATRLKLNSLAEKNDKKTLSVSVENSSSSKTKSSSSSRSYKVVSESSQSKKKVAYSSSLANSSLAGLETFSVRVYNTSEYQVSPGDSVILTGEGFTSSSNIVYLGENRSIPNLAASEKGTKISFLIPNDLPLGKYNIWVTNANGSSKNNAVKIHIIITDNPAERPVVEKVEPREVTYDSEITVSGKGFIASGNSIYSMFGNVLNLSSSDGKTIKFKASSMTQIAKIQTGKSAKNMQAEIWFYVVNDNGYNKEPASFLINF